MSVRHPSSAAPDLHLPSDEELAKRELKNEGLHLYVHCIYMYLNLIRVFYKTVYMKVYIVNFITVHM